MPVASRVEAWIETSGKVTVKVYFKSPPAWRRGLKLVVMLSQARTRRVASRVEAWIENQHYRIPYAHSMVASRVEAWLETWVRSGIQAALRSSPPAWRRGLKLLRLLELRDRQLVASRVEAWIETTPNTRI